MPSSAEHLELVELADTDVRHEELPHARGTHRSHRQEAAVPAVEVADDPDAARIRRPDREAHAGGALVRPGMGAQHVVQPLVRSLGDEVQVDLTDGRPVAERVVTLPGVAVGEREADPVAERARCEARDDPGPQPLAQRLHRLCPAVGSDQVDGGGIGMEGADDRPIAEGVRPEDGVRVVMLATSEPQELVARGPQVDRP